MSKDWCPPPPDNGASYMGRYGLVGNDLMAWLIGRGAGDLIALTPTQMMAPQRAPVCKGPEETLNRGKWRATNDGPCRRQMLYRPPSGWKCYAHAETVVVPFKPRLQDIPAYQGDVFAAVGKRVDLVYAPPLPGLPAEWQYIESEP